MNIILTSLYVIFLSICTAVDGRGADSGWLLVETNGGSAKYGKEPDQLFLEAIASLVVTFSLTHSVTNSRFCYFEIHSTQ